MAAPLFAIEALQNINLPSRLSTEIHYDGIIFISKNAVQHCPMHYLRPTTTVTQIYAVGPVTAAALQAANIEAKTPPQDYSSEGLLALPELQQVKGQHWLIVRGETGRETLKERLQQRGANVDYLACYTRRCLLLPTLDDAIDDISGKLLAPQMYLVTSAATLTELTQQLTAQFSKSYGVEPDWTQLVLITSSQRLLAQAKTLNWQRLFLAKNATDEALVNAAQAALPIIAGTNN